MRIVIASVPKEEIRAKGVGDWMYDEQGRLTVLVADDLEEKHQALVAIHEIVEALKCKWEGVNQDDVTAFDEAFEGLRGEGDTAEPGDEEDAPYFNQHQAATKVEKLCAKLFDISWKVYDGAVNAIWQNKKA